MESTFEIDCEYKKMDHDNKSTLIYPEEETRQKHPWFMYFSAFSANILLISGGMWLVWMSPVIPKLQSNSTDINPLKSPITITQLSALVSFPKLFGPAGILMSAKLADSFGRKRSLLILTTIFICSLIAIAFANHIYFYYVFVSISSFCLPGFTMAVYILNIEIVDDQNRGKMGCIMGLNLPIGTLLGYFIGPVTSVKYFTLICTIPAFLHLALMIFIPESPIFLAMKEKRLECTKGLKKLKNIKNRKEIEKEFSKMIILLDTKYKSKKRNIIDLFRNHTTRKTFFICIGVSAAKELSGILVIMIFMASVFDKIGTISGHTFGITIGCVKLLMFLASAFFVDRLGRKPLLLISVMTCAITLFFLGFYFYCLHIKSTILESITWLPILLVVIFIIGYSLGLGPIPNSFYCELFPNDLRARGCALVFVVEDLVIFINMLSYPFVSQYLGIHYCVWFLCGCCFFGFVWMFFLLPETKGKSFLEIQKLLEK